MTAGERRHRRDAIAPGACSSLPSRMRGRRAERRRPMVSVSVAGHGGRLAARQQALKVRSDSALKMCHRTCEPTRMLISLMTCRTPGRAFVPDLPLPRIKSCDTSYFRRGMGRVWGGPGIVSQLLTGPHSGSGRSPGAARAPGSRYRTRGTPHPAPLFTTPREAPLNGRGGGIIMQAWRGEDKLGE